VIDCPSLDHIPSVINHSAFKEEDVLKRTKNIIHILGEPSILKDERYKAWMNQFPENCNVSHLKNNNNNNNNNNNKTHTRIHIYSKKKEKKKNKKRNNNIYKLL